MLLPANHLKRVLPQRWWPWFHFFTRRVPSHWWHQVSDRRYFWLTGMPDQIAYRKSLVRYELGAGCFAETYWAEVPSADGGIARAGPAAFLVVHGSEIAKFDCYGLGGHYHLASPFPYGPRKALQGDFQFMEKTAEEQVERAIFELQHNSAQYLGTHARRKVRKTRLDPQLLVAVCSDMRTNMLSDLRRLSQGIGQSG